MNTPKHICVYGPTSTGKTTNAEALKEHYGCDTWVDNIPRISCQRDLSVFVEKELLNQSRINRTDRELGYDKPAAKQPERILLISSDPLEGCTNIPINEAKKALGDKWIPAPEGDHTNREEIWDCLIRFGHQRLTMEIAKALMVDEYNPQSVYKYQLNEPWLHEFCITDIPNVGWPKSIADFILGIIDSSVESLKHLQGAPVAVRASVQQYALDKEHNPDGTKGCIKVRVYSDIPPFPPYYEGATEANKQAEIKNTMNTEKTKLHETLIKLDEIRTTQGARTIGHHDGSEKAERYLFICKTGDQTTIYFGNLSATVLDGTDQAEGISKALDLPLYLDITTNPDQNAEFKFPFLNRLEDTKALVKELKSLKGEFSNPPGTDRGEIIANLTLALRHVEDAEARLDKVIKLLNP